MGHFIIAIPSGGKADVRCGKVRKIEVRSISALFKKKQADIFEEKIGYIIRLLPACGEPKEYRLLKTKGGQWISDDAGFPPGKEDDLSGFLKFKIDEYEKNNKLPPERHS